MNAANEIRKYKISKLTNQPLNSEIFYFLIKIFSSLQRTDLYDEYYLTYVNKDDYIIFTHHINTSKTFLNLNIWQDLEDKFGFYFYEVLKIIKYLLQDFYQLKIKSFHFHVF